MRGSGVRILFAAPFLRVSRGICPLIRNLVSALISGVLARFTKCVVHWYTRGLSQEITPFERTWAVGVRCKCNGSALAHESIYRKNLAFEHFRFILID
jgi:hypothetical protein